MTPIGHVSMNSVQYRLRRPPTQILANQMAPKVASGESEYASLDTWSAWVQEDWQEGVGKLNPQKNGGVFYGETETRVPSQMILPALVKQCDTRNTTGALADCRFMPNNMVGTVTVGTGGSARVAIKFTTSGTNLGSNPVIFWLYANIDNVVVTCKIYSDNAGTPNAEVTSCAQTALVASKGFLWHAFTAGAALATSTTFWLVFYPTTSTDSFTVGKGTLGGYAAVSKEWTGSAWADLASTYLMYSSELYRFSNSAVSLGAGFFRFNGTLYKFDRYDVREYNATNNTWDWVVALVDQQSTTGAVTWDTKVYFGNAGQTSYGGNAFYNTMTTAEVTANSGVNGTIFAKHGGYLWRAYLNQVWYSADGTTWTGPFTVCDTGYSIRGMAGLGQNMYFATSDGLYYLAPGDIVVGVGPWGSDSPGNGNRMVAYKGSLYITVSGRLMRFSEDGGLQDVWMTRDDDLTGSRIGTIWDMTTMNNWLVVLVNGASGSTTTLPTVWAFQGDAWHQLATLPFTYGGSQGGFEDLRIFYDRITQRLWISAPQNVTYYMYIPDYTLNPYNDTSYLYMPSAWVEWDWFWGPVRENDKDFESVTIMGENFSANQYVMVYWKDNDSTNWELLGTADADNEELRWPVSTRPNSTRIKLGFLFRTTAGASTPRLRAFRLKYHTMVKDWYRWSLVVDVSGGLNGGVYQEMLNGEFNTLSATTIKSNLDTLATRVPPFVYIDVDGSQYQVKVTEATFNYDKVTYNEQSAAKEWEGTYSMTIEQITQGTYSA